MKLVLVWDFCVGYLLVESLVLISCYLSFFSVPNGLEGVQLLSVEANRIADEL